MALCPQTESQSVLAHGLSVWAYTQRILSADTQGMVIPSWLSENYSLIISSIHDIDTIKLYNVYHDCGKPYCISYDSEGKRHFYNHAEVSYHTFKLYFDNDIAAHLVRNDMCLHTDTAEEIIAKEWTKKDAFTLLITALAELHANSDMFGGVQSTSFKIKYKKVDKRGRMIIKNFL